MQDLDSSYPGGLQEYVKRASSLLSSDENPYEGWNIDIPQGFSYDVHNEAQRTQLEALGAEELQHTCFVLLAGGLGERLGYQVFIDIK